MNNNKTRGSSLFLSVLIFLSALNLQALTSVEDIQKTQWQASGPLLEQILEIQDGVGSIRSYPEFRAYFNLIPMFREKANEFELDSIYPGVVDQLADRLAGHGLRWIKLSQTPINEIMELVRVMKPETVNRLLDDFNNELELLGSEVNEEEIGEKLRALTSYIKENFSGNLVLTGKTKVLLSSLSEKVLTNNPEMQGEDYKTWLSGLEQVRFVENYLLFLYSEVLQASPEQMEQMSFQVLETGSHLQNISNTLPTGVTNIYGDIFVEFLGKALESATPLEEEALKNSITQLSSVYLQGVVFRLIDARNIPPSSYIIDYLETIRLVSKELHERGLTDLAQDLNEKIETRMAAAIATAENHEGTYRLTDGEGNPWTLTIVRATEDRLLATLGLRDGVLYQSLFNVTYSIDGNEYLASDFVPDDNPFPNFVARFQISKEKEIQMELPFATDDSRKNLRGQKVENYPDFFSINKPDATYIAGEYRGRIQLPRGREKEVTLYVQNFRDYSIGRLVLEGGKTQVELQQGTQGGLGFIYLTSGQSRARSFIHLRLKQVEEDETQLTGFVVVGGQGIGRPVNLQKVN